MTSNDLADRYFEIARAGDIDAFAALFADDAVFVSTDGKEYVGRTAIREMEARIYAMGPLSPQPLASVAGPDGIAVESRVETPGGTAYTCNVFRLDEAGLIKRLSVYAKRNPQT